jgi:hypothetical protein
MKVHFKRGWFAPTAAVPDPLRPKGLPVSGTRYRKSASKHDLIEVPEELRKFLPSTATVIENPEAAPVAPKETLRDYDTVRSGQDIAQAKVDAADEEFKKRFEERSRAGAKRK